MDYAASFTAGGILFNEFEAILPHIDTKELKTFLQQESRDNNYLKISTESSRKRVSQEIYRRAGSVEAGFWDFYRSRLPEEKKLLLLYLCIKVYRLVWDFHFKVTIPGYWAYHQLPDDLAYKMYLDELGSKDDEVHSWSELTRKKCITNYLRMLREAGLASGERMQAPDTDEGFYCYFIRAGESWALDAFLLDDREKEKVTDLCQ